MHSQNSMGRKLRKQQPYLWTTLRQFVRLELIALKINNYLKVLLILQSALDLLTQSTMKFSTKNFWLWKLMPLISLCIASLSCKALKIKTISYKIGTIKNQIVISMLRSSSPSFLMIFMIFKKFRVLEEARIVCLKSIIFILVG